MTKTKPFIHQNLLFSFCLFALSAATFQLNAQTVKPLFVTEPVKYDSDDPAIWINKLNPAASLIIGTDKDKNGALYVFDMQGHIIKDKVVHGLRRPNNVDVAYGLMLNGQAVDIAVTTERLTGKLRVYSLPDMQAIDNGGIPVFAGEGGPSRNAPMGIGLYERAADKKIFAIVSRKYGPKDGTYLWQYELHDDGRGQVVGTLVRKFGAFSGKQEIESVAVDDELGYVYYSDEKAGVHKYYADPEKGNAELALFANTGFASEQEGISIYKTGDSTGYILVSDQQANRFQLFTREGSQGNPNDHQLVKVVSTATRFSDGSEVTNIPILPNFPKGVFVAMSDNKTFQLYRWEDLSGEPVVVTPPPAIDDPTGPLVGYWTMDDAATTLLQDASTAHNNANLKGGPGRQKGKKGKALQLTGSQYAVAPASKSLNISNAITLAAWVQPAKKGTQYLIKKAALKKADGYELSLSSNGHAFFRINQASTRDVYRLDAASPYPFDGQTWVHLAATYDGRTMKIYINGIENSSRTFDAPQKIKTSSQGLAIGAQADGLASFKGLIDDARIYNKALTAAEVKELGYVEPVRTSIEATTKGRLVEEQQAATRLQAWPNPFSANTVVQFSFPQTATYTITLHDDKGAQVRQVQQGLAQAGQNVSVKIDGATLAKGLYVLVLKTATSRQSLKLFVIR